MNLFKKNKKAVYKGYTIETLDGYNFAEIYKNKKIIDVCYNLDIAKNEINKMLQSVIEMQSSRI